MAGSEGDWSPTKGWLIAVGHLAIRSVVVAALAVLGTWAMLWLLNAIPMALGRHQPHPEAREALGDLVYVLAVVLGIAEGMVGSWWLVAASGIGGKSLIMPAYVFLGGAHVAAHSVAVRLWPEIASGLMWVFLVLGAVCVFTATARLWLDSR